MQERSRKRAARGECSGSIDNLGVSAGVLCTEPFELNHALIAHIIGQQHLQASCAPTEHAREQTDTRLPDVGRSFAAASQPAPPPRSAALHSAASRVVDSPRPRSAFYVPCTALRAQFDAPRPPAHDKGGTPVQRLAVREASLDSTASMAEGEVTFNATHHKQAVRFCASAC